MGLLVSGGNNNLAEENRISASERLYKWCDAALRMGEDLPVGNNLKNTSGVILWFS